MAERFKALVSKTRTRATTRIAGSNPAPSAPLSLYERLERMEQRYNFIDSVAHKILLH